MVARSAGWRVRGRGIEDLLPQVWIRGEQLVNPETRCFRGALAASIAHLELASDESDQEDHNDQVFS